MTADRMPVSAAWSAAISALTRQPFWASLIWGSLRLKPMARGLNHHRRSDQA